MSGGNDPVKKKNFGFGGVCFTSKREKIHRGLNSPLTFERMYVDVRGGL